VRPERFQQLGFNDNHWFPKPTDQYRFVLSNPHIDGILCSLSSPEQLGELLAALDETPLTPDEQRYISWLSSLANPRYFWAPMLAAIESNINQGGGETSLNSEKTSIAFVRPPYGAPNQANPGLTILALGVMPQLAMPSSLNVAWGFPIWARGAAWRQKGGALRAQLERLGKLSATGVMIAVEVARRYFPASLSKGIASARPVPPGDGTHRQSSCTGFEVSSAGQWLRIQTIWKGLVLMAWISPLFW
jgi:hypothetical protein